MEFYSPNFAEHRVIFERDYFVFMERMMGNVIGIMVTIFVTIYLGDTWGVSNYQTLSIFLLIFLFIKIVRGFGQTVWVFLDVISLLLVLTCLITPMVFYLHFTEAHFLTRLWVKAMPISSKEYYDYAFPASLSLIAGFNLPLIKRINLKYKIKEYINLSLLKRPIRVSFLLILISLFATFMFPFVSEGVKFFIFLMIKLSFVGLFYLFFSGTRMNYIWLLIAGVLLITQALQSGMFGELIFITLIFLILFTIGNNYSFIFKTVMILLGICIIFLIQSIKQDYRVQITEGKNGQSYFSIFSTLISSRFSNTNDAFSEERLFHIADRFNQGRLVAHVIKRVPAVVPFANGETITTSLIASVVPRFLWLNKPKAGGKQNIEKILGWNLGNTSMNIGLLGESFANFGAFWGCLFLFIYGFLFQWCYNFVIKLSHKHPTVIIWIPILFFQAIGVENDVLTVVNHLIKTGFFVFIMYRIFPMIFKIKL
ncbi:hypothetical protein [Haliscomenobacter sp.]|uniref:hypothetical protein n=1 Tax=Haliscomenobacter sp. TaxID=2717303 RepID=UPI003BAC6AC7